MGRVQVTLSDRQREILRLVVEEYVATGQPVGSKTLVERAALAVSTSTVRSELADLERLGLGAARAEVEDALQATTEMLSQVTRLLALVSAPPLEAATVKHVEVLLLQPEVVLVVV